MDQEISAPCQGGHVKIGKQWILGRLMLDSDTPGVITDYHSILQPKNQVICTVYADSRISQGSCFMFQVKTLSKDSERNSSQLDLSNDFIKQKTGVLLPFRNSVFSNLLGSSTWVNHP